MKPKESTQPSRFVTNISNDEQPLAKGNTKGKCASFLLAPELLDASTRRFFIMYSLPTAIWPWGWAATTDRVLPRIARAEHPRFPCCAVELRRHRQVRRGNTAYASVAAATPSSDGVGAWDYVFVTTKALPDYSDDSATIAPLVGPETCIALIQNGLGVEAPFRARFPQNPIVSAVTLVSAEQTSPGVIRQNRWTKISIGPYTDGLGTGSAELRRLGTQAVEDLCRWWGPGLGGIRDVDAHDEIGLQTVRWHKLCINAAMNPSAVLSGGRGNADMVSDPELREHLAGVMQEIWEAAPRILGRPFPRDLATPERILKATERNTGAKPSMLLDWEGERPLELEVILGNPVRIARDHGVEMPRLQSLYALLRSAQGMREEQRKRKKEKL
jgi:2-dehydropantoate 2-reductase